MTGIVTPRKLRVPKSAVNEKFCLSSMEQQESFFKQ